MRIPTGQIDRYIYFVAVDSTDLKTRETGLTTFTVYASLNGGAAGAFTTPTVNETDASNMPGVYELLLDEFTSITAGNDTEELVLHITQASMAPVTRVVELYRPETTEGRTLVLESDGVGHADVKEIDGATSPAQKLSASADTMLEGAVDDAGFTPTITEFESDTITEATADHFIGRIILWTSGNLIRQQARILDYALATGRGHFTVTAMTEIPADTDTFIIV